MRAGGSCRLSLRYGGNGVHPCRDGARDRVPRLAVLADGRLKKLLLLRPPDSLSRNASGIPATASASAPTPPQPAHIHSKRYCRGIANVGYTHGRVTCTDAGAQSRNASVHDGETSFITKSETSVFGVILAILFFLKLRLMLLSLYLSHFEKAV